MPNLTGGHTSQNTVLTNRLVGRLSMSEKIIQGLAGLMPSSDSDLQIAWSTGLALVPVKMFYWVHHQLSELLIFHMTLDQSIIY